MKKSFFIMLLSLLSVAMMAQKQNQKEKKDHGKENVILFLVDDLGCHDLSFTGSKLYDTPNIDALAKSGMVFTNAYASHPRCTPSRYGIQTGEYPARGKVPGGKGALKVTDKTIGEAFKAAGYVTFFAGKWNIGNNPDVWPQNMGYDYNYGGCGSGAPISYFFPYNTPLNPNKNAGKHKNTIIGLNQGVKGEYLTDQLTDLTVHFIKTHKNVPFFAVLSHYAVHDPLEAKKSIIPKYRKRLKGIHFTGPAYIKKDGITKMHQDNVVYAAMIQSVDESLGKLVKALKAEGIYNNTVIILTSDNGGLSNKGVENKRGLSTANIPARAGKGHLYEGGIKVPFIVFWPEVVKPDSHSNQVTVNVDLYPTMLDMAGIKNTNKDIDGVSIVPQLEGAKPVKRTVFWHSPMPRTFQTGDQACTAIRVGNYKLLDFYPKHRIELYNLKSDPDELHNLAEKDPELAKKLDEELNQWKEKVHAVEYPKIPTRWLYGKKEAKEINQKKVSLKNPQIK